MVESHADMMDVTGQEWKKCNMNGLTEIEKNNSFDQCITVP